ncbi:hypothetical protein DICVIV_09828 [Dictyocaulus viviparus]|uniref:Uncharacterized protein n=1 Tax=Dictyocaulus viviparus TaxID=29172 RepID=A0A0D8XK58_DICVI|nr:hypothetical protein DICVIV_09828 [Dictyocaulus viviparus]
MAIKNSQPVEALPNSESTLRNSSEIQRCSNSQMASVASRIFDSSKQTPRDSSDLGKTRESFADRFSKGIHELTQGSSGRLLRWKTKLQNGGYCRRQKDQSEPPPTQRFFLLQNIPEI